MGLGKGVALVPGPPTHARRTKPRAWRAESARHQPRDVGLHKRPVRRIRPMKSREFSGYDRQTRLKQNTNALTCHS